MCIERVGPDSVKGKKQDDLGKLIWSEPSVCTGPWALLKVSTFEKIEFSLSILSVCKPFCFSQDAGV